MAARPRKKPGVYTVICGTWRALATLTGGDVIGSNHGDTIDSEGSPSKAVMKERKGG